MPGISAAAGKTGAAITTFLFPLLLLTVGLKGILFVLAVFSVFLKETKKLSLEDASQDRIVIAPNNSSELENTSSAGGKVISDIFTIGFYNEANFDF